MAEAPGLSLNSALCFKIKSVSFRASNILQRTLHRNRSCERLGVEREGDWERFHMKFLMEEIGLS